MPDQPYRRKSYRGVTYYNEATLWRATIRYAGRRLQLGLYHTKHEAAFAYNHAVMIFFGTQGHPNQILHQDLPNVQRQSEIKANVEKQITEQYP
jgi:hypothetical protein